ncbi:clostridium P-47 protein-domain-containing protein [Dactylonectria macrodidyma]|uniref:Clostridium P-47 protein-domain-containing protein n=1 Tax=Dactylonectria macrodidyma TaxID=307937 RepID=A0A9P9DQF1_9HYPO|nr:clostridium P-47 protein-domain-containing protein [Dactylonectria macrodidyma]
MANMNLNGWDVVALVTIPFVNAAIQNQGGSPPSMQVSTDSLAVQAAFGTWQITTGGSDNILMFNIPLTSISGTATKNGQIVTQFNYQSLAAQVQLVLTFVDGSSTGQNLVVDSKNPPTSVASLMDVNGQPLSNALHDAFIKQALSTWLGDNLSQFNHIFASVDSDPSTASDAQWAFCKPSVVAYTYVSGSSVANSYLGLTYNTAGNTTPGSAAQIDPSFIPAECQAAFMLSPAMFLTNFLAPAASDQFAIPMQSLNIDTSQLSITMAAGVRIPMQQDTVNVPGDSGSDTDSFESGFNNAANDTVGVLKWIFGLDSSASEPPDASDAVIPRVPFLIDLQISVQSSIVTTFAKTSTVVADTVLGDVTAFNTSQSWLTLSFDASNQSLTYTETQPSNNNHSIVESEGMSVAQDVFEAIGAATVTIGAALTDGADLLMVGALAGVAQGGLQWAQSSFDSANQNDAPEITSLVSNLTLPVNWSSAGPFSVTQAGLYQGGFFLAGTLRPTS